MSVKIKSKPFDLSTWDGFSDISKDELDYLLDTTSVNKRLADNKDNPYRWRTGSFLIPKGITGRALEKLVDEKVKKWLEIFERQDMILASSVQLYKGNKFGYDLASGALLLDKEEMRCRAIFKIKPIPMRIEVPPDIVKQDPEHRVSLEEAMKIENIKPVPMEQRIKDRGK